MIHKLVEKYREIIVYICVGLLTTLVAYGVRFAVLYPFASMLSVDLTVNNAEATILRTAAITVGWVAGVIFALFTKSWVFQDKVSEKRAVWVQFGKFTLSRVSTYFVEWALGALVPMLLIALGFVPFTFIVITVDADMIATAVSIVLVTVLNYILSKLLVFTKKK